jgi:hypothetical protein
MQEWFGYGHDPEQKAPECGRKIGDNPEKKFINRLNNA